MCERTHLSEYIKCFTSCPGNLSFQPPQSKRSNIHDNVLFHIIWFMISICTWSIKTSLTNNPGKNRIAVRPRRENQLDSLKHHLHDSWSNDENVRAERVFANQFKLLYKRLSKDILIIFFCIRCSANDLGRAPVSFCASFPNIRLFLFCAQGHIKLKRNK